MDMLKTEVAVVGGGPAGVTAAIALSQAGIETALIAKPPAQDDYRTTALLLSSVTALETLGVWPSCAPKAAALRRMRIVDDTARLLHAPETTFDAAEIGLSAFGYNLQNRDLLAALDGKAKAQSHALLRIDSGADAISFDRHGATISLASGGAVQSRLVIGADGRHSLCRNAAGIDVDRHSYGQTALTFNLAHARRHENISTEFHTRQGPFTLVPLPGQRSSLVLVTDPDQAQRIAALDDNALAEELERRSHALLGRLTLLPGRGAFPLVLEMALQFAASRIALISEAAHVLPPIGAQGLNLGLRDAAAIAEIAIDARRAGEDLGAELVLDRYVRARRPDAMSRAMATDMFNRTLMSDFLPLQGARQFSFFMLRAIGPLRRALMREGVAPVLSQPRLMRGEAL